MVSVLIFFAGLFAGALGATIAIIAGYGKDADDYYEGSTK